MNLIYNWKYYYFQFGNLCKYKYFQIGNIWNRMEIIIFQIGYIFNSKLEIKLKIFVNNEFLISNILEIYILLFPICKQSGNYKYFQLEV